MKSKSVKNKCATLRLLTSVLLLTTLTLVLGCGSNPTTPEQKDDVETVEQNDKTQLTEEERQLCLDISSALEEAGSLSPNLVISIVAQRFINSGLQNTERVTACVDQQISLTCEFEHCTTQRTNQ